MGQNNTWLEKHPTCQNARSKGDFDRTSKGSAQRNWSAQEYNLALAENDAFFRPACITLSYIMILIAYGCRHILEYLIIQIYNDPKSAFSDYCNFSLPLVSVFLRYWRLQFALLDVAAMILNRSQGKPIDLPIQQFSKSDCRYWCWPLQILLYSMYGQVVFGKLVINLVTRYCERKSSLAATLCPTTPIIAAFWSTATDWQEMKIIFRVWLSPFEDLNTFAKGLKGWEVDIIGVSEKKAF